MRLRGGRLDVDCSHDASKRRAGFCRAVAIQPGPSGRLATLNAMPDFCHGLLALGHGRKLGVSSPAWQFAQSSR